LIWIALVMLALVPVARFFLFEIDHQYANLAAAGLIVVASLFGYFGIWVSYANTLSRRLLLLVTPLVAIGAAYSAFEFVGFTGETLPVFRKRAWLSKLTRSSEKASTVEEGVADAVGGRSGRNQEPAVRIGSEFRSSQFLGDHRNGVIESPEFDVAWDRMLPKVLWRKPIGAGWSSFAVESGLAITLEQIDEQESVTALELHTGKTLWQVKLPGRHFQAFGGLGPRSTPTIDRGKVYAQTAMGIVVCLDLQSGAIVWQKDLLALASIDKEVSEQGILWGRSGSGLVVGEQVVFPFGGKNGDPNIKSLISFNVKDGEVLWTGGSSQISYASPELHNLGGVSQIVSVNEGNVTGHNPTNGDVLWSAEWPSHSNADACASQPVWIDERRVLLGKGYALGSKMIEIVCNSMEKKWEASSWSVSTVWESPKILKTKFTNSLYHNGYLYALSDGVLECVDPKDGTRVWRGKRYGQGQALIVNGHVLVLGEDGLVALVGVQTPEGAKPSARVVGEMQVLEGITWNIPTVAGPYLLVRNAEEVVCLISEKDSDRNVQSKAP
jgi:outer membrane protein assembly factor BamB